MMPILLISKNVREINTYVADFVKKHALLPSSVFYYRKNPQVITIEQIREIQSLALRTTDTKRLFIVYDFETAKKETQNAFLKTLEESTGNTQFILIVSHQGSVISTIVSRCTIRKSKVKSQKLKVNTLKMDDFFDQSLAQLFIVYTVSGREEAVHRCDMFLAAIRDMMRYDLGVGIARSLKEIIKTRALILKNNVNPQIAVDHLLYTIKKQIPIDKNTQIKCTKLCMNKSTSGFTLFEMLIVISILSILIMIGMVSYSAVQKSSRDGRRKADIEQIRIAFEQWRSDYGSYPTTLTIDCTDQTLVSGTNVYLQKVPKDPQCPTRTYKGIISASDYTLGAGLESVTSVCAGLVTACGGGTIDCSYCVGPYGQK